MSKKVPQFFILFVILAVIFTAFALYNRSLLESKTRQVEIVMSLDELRELTYQEGYGEEEILKKMRSAGIHSIAIHEDTLEKLEATGDILFFSTEEFSQFQFFLKTLKIDDIVHLSLGESYIVFNDADKFERIKDNLERQLGKHAVGEYSFLNFRSLKIKGSEDKLKELGLGFSEKDIQRIKALGYDVILRFKNYPSIDKEGIELRFNEAKNAGEISGIIFDGESVLGFPDKEAMLFTSEMLKINHLPFGIIEFANQEGIKTIAQSTHTLAVKVHSITKEEMEIISSQKAIDRWIRAAKERKIRILYIKPFLNSEMNLLEKNLSYVANIKKELIANDFNLGRASLFSDLQISRLFLIIFILGISSAGIILLNHILNLKKNYNYFLLGLGIILSLLLILLGRDVLLLKFFALLSALIFPSLAIVANSKYFLEINCNFSSGRKKQYYPINSGYLYMIKDILKGYFKIIFITLSGALLIAALLSNGKFILGIDQFSGIKISYLLPLFLVLLILWLKKNQGNMSIMKTIKQPILIEHIVILAFFAVFLIIYIARSGNFSFLPVLGIEEKIRVFLEKTLIARPRNKEFLIGYPALMLAMSMNYLKIKEFKLTLVIVGTIGPVTLINTFCHIHTPFTFSLLRTFNGIWLGTLLGIIVVSVFYFIVKKFRKIVDNEKI